MNLTFDEMQKRLFELNPDERKHMPFYEQYRKKHENSNKFDYVSSVYVPDYYLDGRTLYSHTHDRFSPPNYHTHNFYEVICILEGEFINIIEGHEKIMKKGDVCILPPNIYHSFDIIEGDVKKRTQALAINIFLKASAAPDYFTGCGNDSLEKFVNAVTSKNNHRKFAFFACRDNSVFQWLIKLFYYETHVNMGADGTACEKVAASLMRTVIAEILSERYVMTFSTSFTNNSSTGDIIKFISDNYRTVTLEQVAENFNYSFSYASKVIKQRTGLGFSELLTGIRIDKACDMLKSTDKSIREIASDCGYGSIEHFHRAFRRLKSTTPAQFRESP